MTELITALGRQTSFRVGTMWFLKIFNDLCKSWVKLETLGSSVQLKTCSYTICVYPISYISNLTREIGFPNFMYVCVTRWLWELERGYKDEHTSVHQHRCPLCSCLQQHSSPVACCGIKGRRRCCELINTFALCIPACLHTYTIQAQTMLFPYMLQNLQVFLDGVSVARLDSLLLCYPDRMTLLLNVTPTEIQISGNSSAVTYIKSDALQEALKCLNTTMQNPISTYIGGIPG